MTKKIISFLLLIALIFPVRPISAAEQDGLNEEASDSYNMLCAFGIIDKKNDNISSDITREQAMDFILRLGNITLNEDDTVSYFIDVGSDSEYLRHINTAYSCGIIKGNGNGLFNPKENMTVGSFAVCLLRLAGYGEYIDKISVQSFNSLQKPLLKGVEYRINDTLTASDMFIMMANILEFKYMNMVGVVNEGDYSDIIYNNDKDETVMSELLGINIYTGRIVATNDVAIGGRALTYGNNVIVKLSDEGDTRFESDDRGFKDCVGLTVDLYVKDDDNKVIYYKNNDKTAKDYIIDGFYVESVPSNLTYMDYYPDKKSSLKRASFDSSTVFVYNGRMCYEISKEDMTQDVDSLRIIDFDNDGTYDIVYIWNYDIAYVTDVSLASKSIDDKITMKEIFLDEESSDYDVEIFKDGQKIEFSKLVTGNVLTIAVSKGGRIQQKKTVYVSSKVVSGKLETIDSANYTLTIDSKNYKTTYDFDFDSIKNGNIYTFLMDYTGNLACVAEQSSGDVKYGYMISIAKSGTINEQIGLQIFTSDNELQEFNLAKKFYYNGKKGSWGLIETDLFNASGEPNQQLLAYKLNDESEISQLFSAPLESGAPPITGSETLSLNSVLMKSSTIPGSINQMYLGGRYIMDANTLVFTVKVDDNGRTGETGVKIIDNPKTEFPYVLYYDKIMVYDSDYMRTPKVVVIHQKGVSDRSVLKIKTIPMVVERIFKAVINEDTKTVIQGYEPAKSTARVTYAIDSNLDVSGLKPGMVITYMKNSKDEIDEIFIKYAQEKSSWYDDKTALYGDADYTPVAPGLISNSGYEILDPYVSFCGRLTGRTTTPQNIMRFSISGTEEEFVFLPGSKLGVYEYDTGTDTLTQTTWQDIELDSEVFVYAKQGVAQIIVSYVK